MNWKDKESNTLVEALLALKSPAEARRFLRDLLTEGEIEEFAKRLQTAQMLSAKDSYPAIQKATGFSTTTIARVSKWLQTGEGGYRLVLNRLHHSPSSR
jgi:TrpR-related protein YerC/YecD